MVPKFLHTLLAGLARLIYARAGIIVIAAVVGTLVAGYLTYQNFVILNSISALLDEDSASNRAYLQYKKDFGVDEEYVLVIRGDDPAKNRAAADALAGKLEAIGDGIKQVFYKIDYTPLKSRLLLQEDVKGLKEVRAQILGMTERLKGDRPTLDLSTLLTQTNDSFDDAYLREADNWKEFRPFIARFQEMITKLSDSLQGRQIEPLSNPLAAPEAEAEEKVSQAAQAAADEPTDPYWTEDEPTAEQEKEEEMNLMSSADVDAMLAEREYVSYLDGKMLIVLATPGVRETDGASPFTKTLAAIRKAMAEVEGQYLDEKGDPTVTIGLTGEPVLNDDEMQTATVDATRASIITFVLITALFGVCYKERLRPFIAIIVLLLAVVWSFAYTMLSIGHLNIITQAFVPMMLGLGIDFGVQILGRYEEELSRGKSVKDALIETLTNTGSAVLTSGIITAAAFYTMCFNDFVGLRELGNICGTSLLFCIIVNLIVLPAVFVVRDRRRSHEDLVMHAKRSSWTMPAELNRKFLSKPGAMAGLGAVITVLALVIAPYVKFDYNLLNLQNPELDSVIVEHELIRDIGTSSLYAAVIVDNLDQAREKTKQLKDLYGIKEVNSVADMVPPNQEKRLIYAREIVDALQPLQLDSPDAGSLDPAAVRQRLEVLLANSQQAVKEAEKYRRMSGMAREAIKIFSGLIPPLEKAVQQLKEMEPEAAQARLVAYDDTIFKPLRTDLAWLREQKVDRPITLEDVPTALQKRLIGKDNKLLVQVFSSEDIWERKPLVDFLAQVRSVDPKVTGTPTQNEAYVELLRESYLEAAIWAFVAIVVLIFLHFRNVSYALLAILPLVLGVLWTLGVMSLVGIKFNPANIMTLPMVIGIGVAYGVYTIDRFREEKRLNLFSTSTGKSILLSALTTMIAFGSMLTASYTGLMSMGQVMTLGVFMCLLTSIVFLPQLLVLIWPSARGDGPDNTKEGDITGKSER